MAAMHHYGCIVDTERPRKYPVLLLLVLCFWMMMIGLSHQQELKISKYLVPLPQNVDESNVATNRLYFKKLPIKIILGGTELTTSVIASDYPILNSSLSRYDAWLWKQSTTTTTTTSTEDTWFFDWTTRSTLEEDFTYTGSAINVEISDKDKIPALNVYEIDESYEISVKKNSITIKSVSQFGFLRGLETFTRMIRADKDNFYIPNVPVMVKDFPRFKHRGLLIDVARNYIYPSTIKQLLDLMSFDKMNVLHIHLYDAQSFPYEVYGEFSALSSIGQYAAGLVYSNETIADLIEYAYVRGIMVIPEFDMPGHAKAFEGVDGVVSTCPEKLGKNINNYPLNIAQEKTYKLVEALLGQWQDRSVLNAKTKIASAVELLVSHLGSDEVVKACWAQDQFIFDYFNCK